MELDVRNIKGEKIGTVALDQEALLGPRASESLVHEVVRGFLANQRQGSASTKTRSEVSGGGHKPWKQKHTGRARAGSIRSPLWRKGGIIFGPKPREYRQTLPATKRAAALREAIRLSLESGRLGVVDSFSVPEAKTKHVAEGLKKLGVGDVPCLVVVSPWDKSLWQAARNIPTLGVRTVDTLNAYECLAARRILFTQAALDTLPARLHKGGSPS